MTALKNGRFAGIHVRGLFAALLVCGVSLSFGPAAGAASFSKGNIGKAGIVQNGRTTTITNGAPPTNSGGSTIPVSPNMGGWTQAGNYGVAPGATGPTAGINYNGKFIVGGSGGKPGVSYPFQGSSGIDWKLAAPVAAGIVCVVTTAGYCAVAAAVLPAIPGILDWMSKAGIQRDPQTGELTQPERSDDVQLSDGFMWRTNTLPTYRYSKLYACRDYADWSQAQTPGIHWPEPVKVIDTPQPNGSCALPFYNPSGGFGGEMTTQLIRGETSPCPSGWYMLANSPSSCYSSMPQSRLTADQLGEILGNVMPPDGRPWGEILERGGEVPVGDPQVTGPNSVKGPETVKQNADGTKQVTNTTYNFTTNNNTVTNTHNTTTTSYYNSNNQKTGEDTETETPVEAEVPNKQTDEPKGLCELYPDIVACAKIDSPEGEIPKEDKEVSFEEQQLFGTGSCPADVYTTLHALGGSTVKVFNWTQACEWALPLRALVLALAALTAAFILMPAGVRE